VKFEIFNQENKIQGEGGTGKKALKCLVVAERRKVVQPKDA
jgi:hypothetical protein